VTSYSSTHCSLVLTSPRPATLASLSLHDALPIFGVHDLTRGIGHLGDRGEHAVFPGHGYDAAVPAQRVQLGGDPPAVFVAREDRSEEHTSELQSRFDLVCRLLLDKINQDPKHSTS